MGAIGSGAGGAVIEVFSTHSSMLIVCCVVYGVWCVLCGVWCMVCGVWCVVCGVWCVVCGVW